MKRFEGKTALITGAARGIGRGIALCLAEEGANIIVNDRANLEMAEDVVNAVKAMGQEAIFWQADVSDREAVAAMFAGIIEQFGRIDVVVSNAAFSIREPVIEAKWENVLSTLEVTQFGVFHVCQMAAQQMIKQQPNERSRGKIVIISSVQSEVAAAESAAYNMAKAAINHFAQTLAVELAEYRINVNVINPGWIDTPGERAFYTEEEIQEGGRQLPWGRIGTPDDIGKAAAFLASDDADYITGTILRVDGGYVVARSTVD
jgi:glucose 1-dehydrogenase